MGVADWALSGGVSDEVGFTGNQYIIGVSTVDLNVLPGRININSIKLFSDAVLFSKSLVYAFEQPFTPGAGDGICCMLPIPFKFRPAHSPPTVNRRSPRFLIMLTQNSYLVLQ